jgi:hypothetical protein
MANIYDRSTLVPKKYKIEQLATKTIVEGADTTYVMQKLWPETIANQVIQETGLRFINQNSIVLGSTYTNGVLAAGSAETGYTTTINAGSLAGNIALTLPNIAGTIALTSDIPNLSFTDGILDGAFNTSTGAISLAPYGDRLATPALSFYLGITDPTITTRLNLDGALFATSLEAITSLIVGTTLLVKSTSEFQGDVTLTGASDLIIKDAAGTPATVFRVDGATGATLVKGQLTVDNVLDVNAAATSSIDVVGTSATASNIILSATNSSTGDANVNITAKTAVNITAPLTSVSADLEVDGTLEVDGITSLNNNLIIADGDFSIVTGVTPTTTFAVTASTGETDISGELTVTNKISGNELQIDNININGNTISSTDSSGTDPILYGEIILDPNPVGNSGTVRIKGDLIIDGTTVTLNASELSITDLDIIVAKNATNATEADGAGILVGVNGGIAGFTFEHNNLGGTKDSFTSTDNLNLLTEKAYHINGAEVLSSTALGSAVVTSSLTSVGIIGTGTWEASIISPTYGGTGVNNATRTLTIASNSGTLTFGSSGSLTINDSATIGGAGSVTLNKDLTVSTGDVTINGNSDDTSVLTLPAGALTLAAPVAGAIIYGSANNYSMSAVGTAGQALLSGAAGAPTWTVGTLAIGSGGLEVTGSNKLTLEAAGAARTLKISGASKEIAGDATKFTVNKNGTLTFVVDKTLTVNNDTTLDTNSITLASTKSITAEHASLVIGDSTGTGTITVKSDSSTARSLTLNSDSTITGLTANHVLYASATNTIAGEAQLAISRGGTGLSTTIARTILAAPLDQSVGANGAPVWRSLVNDDLPNTGIAASTYSVVQVNAKGVVTVGAQLIEVGGTNPSNSLAVGGIFFQEVTV